MAKALVRLKPQSEWRSGLTKPALVADMRASLIEIPSVAFNFAQPIRDSVEESTSGARGHVVLKLFGPDSGVMRGLLETTKAALHPIEGVVDGGEDGSASIRLCQHHVVVQDVGGGWSGDCISKRSTCTCFAAVTGA